LLNNKEGKPQLWIGAKLLSVLEEKAAINYNDISKLAATAPDGYNSVIYNELLLHLNTAILSYSLGNEGTWLKEYGNVRLIYPGLREMYFVNNPQKIIVYTNPKDSYGEEKSHQTLRLHFLDRKNELNGNVEIPVEKILSHHNLSGRNFSVLTTDSLEREYLNNELSQKLVLKKEKNGTWKIGGSKVPVGLRTRNIFYLFSYDVGIFLKLLSKEEIILWENYLRSSLSGTENFKIEIVKSNGERFLLENPDDIQIYKIIEKQLELFPDVDYVQLIYER
jgi:hypothetical protein